MTDWQPIETAPKDGRAILLWSTVFDVHVCKWMQPSHGPSIEHIADAKRWVCVYDHVREFHNPTHWMPIPAPPKQ